MESYKDERNFSGIVQHCVLAVLLFATVLLFSPVFISTLLLLIVWRFIVATAALMFKSLGSMIDGPGVLFLVDNYLQKPHCTLLATFFLEGKPDVLKIRDNWKSVMKAVNQDGSLKYDRLWQYPYFWLGYAFWKLDSNFQIDNHIKLVNNPGLNENNLEDYISVIFRSPFPPNRPLWDVSIIPKYNDNEEQFVAVVRVHHIITDGISAMKLLLFAGMDEVDKGKSNGLQLPVTSNKSWMKRLDLFIRTVIGGPYTYVRKMITMQDKNCIQNQDEIPPSGNWMYSFLPPIELEKLKDAHRALKIPLIVIIIRAFADALNTYIEENFGADKVPEKIHVMFPSPLPNHPDDRLVNYWTVIIVKITSKLKTILGRLQELTFQFIGERDSSFPVVSPLMFKIAGKLPKMLVTPTTKFKGCTLFCTNIPGPQNQIKLFNHEVSDVVICIPLMRDAYAIGFGIISYNGYLRITCGTDKAYIPDKEHLNRYMALVSNELEKIMEEGRKIENDDRKEINEII